MLKELLFLAIPYLKPVTHVLFKKICELVLSAEKKYIEPRMGKVKKSEVLIGVADFLEITPEYKAKLERKLGEKLDAQIDNLVEKAVTELINKVSE